MTQHVARLTSGLYTRCLQHRAPKPVEIRGEVLGQPLVSDRGGPRRLREAVTCSGSVPPIFCAPASGLSSTAAPRTPALRRKCGQVAAVFVASSVMTATALCHDRWVKTGSVCSSRLLARALGAHYRIALSHDVACSYTCLVHLCSCLLLPAAHRSGWKDTHTHTQTHLHSSALCHTCSGQLRYSAS